MELTSATLSKEANVASTSARARIPSLDLARGVALFSMVVIHVITFMGSDATVHSAARNAIASVVCLLAAPAFMFIMGVVLSLSVRKDLRGGILRGLGIFGLGYLLNFLRGTLPVFVCNWAKIAYEPSDVPALSYMLEIDILQFAGLALVLLSIIKHFVPWRLTGLVLGGIALVASPFFWTMSASAPVAGYLLTLFSGSAHFSFFPFFPWIVFPLFGMTYGRFLRGAGSKGAFFVKSAIAGAVALAAGVALSYVNHDTLLNQWASGEFLQGKLPPAMSLCFTGFVCMWLALCFWIVERIPKNAVVGRLYFWSRNVTLFYCIQWILIGWLCVVLPPCSWLWTIAAIIGVTLLTDRIMISFAKK
jgi:uncharacterized membrane protein